MPEGRQPRRRIGLQPIYPLICFASFERKKVPEHPVAVKEISRS